MSGAIREEPSGTRKGKETEHRGAESRRFERRYIGRGGISSSFLSAIQVERGAGIRVRGRRGRSRDRKRPGTQNTRLDKAIRATKCQETLGGQERRRLF